MSIALRRPALICPKGLNCLIDPTQTCQLLHWSSTGESRSSNASSGHAEVLIFDEPTAVLTPISADLFASCAHLRHDGKIVIS